MESDPFQDRLYSLSSNAVLHGAPSGTTFKLQRVQNNATRIVHQAPRRSHVYSLLKELHWLPVEQRVSYKLAVLTFKIRHRPTSTPAYLSLHITSEHAATLGHCGRRLFRFSYRTDIGKRSFSCAAPATWNSRSPAVINCGTLPVFISTLKTHLFNTAHS